MECVVGEGFVGRRESREPVVAEGRRSNVKGRKPRARRFFPRHCRVEMRFVLQIFCTLT